MVFNESLNLTVLGGWKISFKISSFECVKLYWNSAEFDGFSRSKTPKFLLLANHGGRHFAKFYASFRKILATPHFCKKIAQIINMLLLFLSKGKIIFLSCAVPVKNVSLVQEILEILVQEIFVLFRSKIGV